MIKRESWTDDEVNIVRSLVDTKKAFSKEQLAEFFPCRTENSVRRKMSNIRHQMQLKGEYIPIRRPRKVVAIENTTKASELLPDGRTFGEYILDQHFAGVRFTPDSIEYKVAKKYSIIGY
jgi:hypothetical protein